MNSFLAYVRVSTVKQGEHGVSLEAQREAITRYAERNGIAISQWFEERETAAKRGRPVFTQVLRSLRRGQARGLLVHKIDRSARNLKDWADLGELIDSGIQVHFVNESLDLHSRGGRLSADIQAVVAADFIRNLSEETRKGHYGRLRQGVYPFPAPLGYVNTGRGNAKQIDPAKGHLVRKAFELYASGRHSLVTLADELYRLGLRGRHGSRVDKNRISLLLTNPFYMGVVRLKRTGEVFAGVHEPLVSRALFERVQDLLLGRTRRRGFLHDFLFRQLLICAVCGRSLTGERQKGHVYYRCHGRHPQSASIREESIEATILDQLARLHFDSGELRYFEERLPALKDEWQAERTTRATTVSLRLSKIREQLDRLTDALLDQAIDKRLFHERQELLLAERRALEEAQAHGEPDPANIVDQVGELFELAGTASTLYKSALPEEKRDLLQILSSNRRVTGKSVELMLSPPFDLIAERPRITTGCPLRDEVRTRDDLAAQIWRWVTDPLRKTSTAMRDFLQGIRDRDEDKTGELAA